LTAWADASIDYRAEKPRAVRHAEEKPYVLTPPPAAAPRINGASAFGARPGHPVLYTIAASGDRPMTFSAENLPPGLALDGNTGRITGEVAKRGEYRVRITAKNRRGSATREIVFAIGDTLALTPPMGWNSWNSFADAVTAADVRASADIFVR